jgi:hypothetical protein
MSSGWSGAADALQNIIARNKADARFNTFVAAVKAQQNQLDERSRMWQQQCGGSN